MKVNILDDNITIYVSGDKKVFNDKVQDAVYEENRSYAVYGSCKVDRTGSYFGYFSEHFRHGCTNLGNFDLENLQLTKRARIEYSTVLNTSGIFNPNNLHTVVNIDDKSNDSFTNEEKLLNTISASNGTDGKNIHFLHWGTEANRSEIINFITKLSLNETRGLFMDNSNYQECVNKTADYIKDLFLQNCNKNMVVKEQPSELNVTPASMRKNSATGSGKYMYGKWTVKHYSKTYTGNNQVNQELYGGRDLIEADLSGSNVVAHTERLSKYATKSETRKYIDTKYKNVNINDDDDPTNDVVTGSHIKGDGTVPGETKDIDYYDKQDEMNISNSDLKFIGNAIVLRSMGYESYNTSSNNTSNIDGSYKICRAYSLNNAEWVPGQIVVDTSNSTGNNIDDFGVFDGYTQGKLTTLETGYKVIDADGNDLGITQETHKYVIRSGDWDKAPFKIGKFIVDEAESYTDEYVVYKEVPIYLNTNYKCYPVYKDTVIYEYDPVWQKVSYQEEVTESLAYDNNLNMYYFDDEVGLYEIYYADELVKTVFEHRRPHAEFDIRLSELDNEGYRTVTYTNKSYDLDSYYSLNQVGGENRPGIEKCEWSYIDSESTTWKKGRPNKINADLTYVVKLTVTDGQGESVSTTKTVGGYMAPPVADFTLEGDKIITTSSGEKSISMYNNITINDMSYDPNSLELIEYYWTVSYKKDDSSTADILCQDQSQPISSFSKGEGIYTYELKVKNSKNIVSDIHMESIIVTDDNTPPDITVEPLWCDWADYCDITISVKDNDSGFEYMEYAFTENSDLPEDKTYLDGSGWDGAWSDKITTAKTKVRIDKDGKWYLHVRAFDKAGNMKVYKTLAGNSAGLYLIDTTKPTIQNVEMLTHVNYVDFKFNTHDYSQKYQKFGSGVAYYGYSESETVEPTTWYADPSYLKIYKGGVYYLYIKDLKGNVSLPYEVKMYNYILDYKYNYKGNTDSFEVSDEILYKEKFKTAGVPIRDKYKFMGWNSSPLGTGKDLKPNYEYIMDDAFLNNELNAKSLVGGATIKLYAHWKKDLKLTFNLNGGQYKYSKMDIELTGNIYNDQPSYTFNIIGGKTTKKLPYYDEQVNQFNCYGTVTNNGMNQQFTKMDSNYTRYRLLGWSRNALAEVPDDDLIVYDESHINTLTITDDTTLYAVWEPILEVRFNVNTTIDSGDTGLINAGYKGTFNVKAAQGSGCNYTILSSTLDNKDIQVMFDSKITDIYTHSGNWNDSLNPSTEEDLIDNQKHGLNRFITTDMKYIKRDFAIPNKLGTRYSYVTSINVADYTLKAVIEQDSYFYSHYMSGQKEQVEIEGTITLVNKSSSEIGIDPRNPDYNYNGISRNIETTLE